jgi:2-keto-4-pentenoate hydratase/2-oxohepta-3-ene-1,7-dioic acid hydratase in catechol pathway
MVRNIFCIGKNYLDHIKELDTPAKTAEVPKTPVVFLKPTSAIMTDRVMVTIPVFNGKPISNDLQNEVELVVIIGKGGYDIPAESAMEYVLGYAVGIDFTLRDIQSDAKAKGLPWEISKGFRFSSPVSEIVKKEEVGDPEKLGIRLKVNGVTKQDGNTSEMIFRISYIIHYLSSIFGLSEGDIIFTGTTAGVTKLYPGDIIEAEIDTIGKLNIKIG